MPFQMPVTIADVLRRIQAQDYVLPAIQRELVWSTEQMARLFDSLMRDYPIGSFLFWKIEARHASDFTFYGFIRDYHQKDAPHWRRAGTSGEDEGPVRCERRHRVL